MGTPPLRVAFEDFELDEARNELRRDGARVDLQPKPLQLLFYLVHHRDRVVPARELHDEVWPDVIVAPTALSSALREIRQALEDTGTTQRMVQTLRGHGYRFIAEVSELSGEPEPGEKSPTVVDGAEHRLAALLIADVVGYSRLIAEDEDATVRTLAAYREEIELLLRQHRGRLVDFTGDNFLAEFASALSATRCAVDIQGVLRSRNTQLPPERRVEFRMGVHLGDVRVEGERIYGDGVNIAARLQALAEPGGVCISGTVHEQVERKLGLDFEDLGEQEVHNIPRPVRVYRLVAEPELRSRPTVSRRRSVLLALWTVLVVGVVGLLLWQLWPDPGREPFSLESDTETTALDERFTVPGFGGAPAIAVLPFDNLSGDPDQEYFADGMAEELITRLSAIGWFPVIARNSSFTYKGQAVDVRRVSEELGARYVVEGSVRKAGDRVRISAQLIDAASGAHVWAETYDRELRDIFAMQDEIAESIVASINPALMTAEITRIGRREPRDLDAYDQGLRGWWHLGRGTAEGNARARLHFKGAIELEPGPGAFAGLAWTHMADMLISPPEPESAAEMMQAAQRSVELDANSAWAHLTLGWATFVVAGDAEGMSAELERAIELDPSLALAYALLSLPLAHKGRAEEARALSEKAIRLSPRDSWLWWFYSSLAASHFAAGRYEDAVDWWRRSIRANPWFPVSRAALAAAYAELGQLDDARSALEELRRVQPGFSLSSMFQRLPHGDYRDRFRDGLRKAGLPEE